MDNISRNNKEQLLRSRKLTSSEKNLLNMYMSLMQREKEGTIKQEIYNIFKDQNQIIDSINSNNQCII